jgi:hypothetical protein
MAKGDLKAILLAGTLTGAVVGAVAMGIVNGCVSKVQTYSNTERGAANSYIQLEKLPKIFTPAGWEYYGHWWANELKATGYGAGAGAVVGLGIFLKGLRKRRDNRPNIY